MKKFLVIFVAIITALNLGANPGTGSEQLLGVSVIESGIHFQVYSNGCTKKEDFAFEVEERLKPISPYLPAYEHHFYITVKRLRDDDCQLPLPYGTTLFVSFAELSINTGKFHINNPIGGSRESTK